MSSAALLHSLPSLLVEYYNCSRRVGERASPNIAYYFPVPSHPSGMPASHGTVTQRAGGTPREARVVGRRVPGLKTLFVLWGHNGGTLGAHRAGSLRGDRARGWGLGLGERERASCVSQGFAACLRVPVRVCGGGV